MAAYVVTMQGLGDCFAARPVVRILASVHSEVFVETSWPEVFEDIAQVQFVKPEDTTLRCQRRNVEAQPKERWVPRPRVKQVRLGYDVPGMRAGQSMPKQQAERAGVTWAPGLLGMRVPAAWAEGCPIPAARYTVFRQATVRSEYRNLARNPGHGAIGEVLQNLPCPHVHVNDLWHGEVLMEPRLPANEEYLHAQLPLRSLLYLVANAAAVLAPVSWLAWAGLAFGVPTWCVFGGYAPPHLVFGEYGWPNLQVFVPQPFCCCFDPTHMCAK